METISLQNRLHFLIGKFYYLTISQALQCIFFFFGFFFFFASFGKFNYLFLWEINSSRLWWAGKFTFFCAQRDCELWLEIFKHWLPSFRCSSHFASAIIIISILSSVSDLASTKLWYVASGLISMLKKKKKNESSLFFHCVHFGTRNLRNKTKQKFEIQRKKNKKKKKKGSNIW